MEYMIPPFAYDVHDPSSKGPVHTVRVIEGDLSGVSAAAEIEQIN